MKKHILVIDDTDDIRKGIVEMLECWGYSCIEANSGTEGIRMLTENKDSTFVVVTDYDLGDMNGVAVVESCIKITHVPIIIATGTEDFDNVSMSGIRAGATAVLRKPTDLKQMQKIRDYVTKAYESA